MFNECVIIYGSGKKRKSASTIIQQNNCNSYQIIKQTVDSRGFLLSGILSSGFLLNNLVELSLTDLLQSSILMRWWTRRKSDKRNQWTPSSCELMNEPERESLQGRFQSSSREKIAGKIERFPWIISVECSRWNESFFSIQNQRNFRGNFLCFWNDHKNYDNFLGVEFMNKIVRSQIIKCT